MRMVLYLGPSRIYLKLMTNLSHYAHILLIEMLHFDRIIKDYKLSKARYVNKWAYSGPIFCLLHKIFDVSILAKPFLFLSLKHFEILSWSPTYPIMGEVMRLFGTIKTNMRLSFAFDARFRVYAHTSMVCCFHQSSLHFRL